MKTVSYESLVDMLDKIHKRYSNDLAGESGRGSDYEEGFRDGLMHVRNTVIEGNIQIIAKEDPDEGWRVAEQAAHCPICDHTWVPMWPQGLKKMECPNCGVRKHIDSFFE